MMDTFKPSLILYSVKLCPFVQRVRLVLMAKELTYREVYINVDNKPEWYFKINSKGLVPSLVDDANILTDSLNICDYLDEKYPNNPLYPNDPEIKRKDKELIQKIDLVIAVFRRCMFTKEEKAPEEWLKEFLFVLEVFEVELAKRGTKFFEGDKPGMVDYMLWPWAQRAEAVNLKLGIDLSCSKIPLLYKWKRNMYQEPMCQEPGYSTEEFWKIIQAKISKKIPII